MGRGEICDAIAHAEAWDPDSTEVESESLGQRGVSHDDDFLVSTRGGQPLSFSSAPADRCSELSSVQQFVVPTWLVCCVSGIYPGHVAHQCCAWRHTLTCPCFWCCCL